MSCQVDANKWVCETCTYENWPVSKKCTICRNSRPTRLIQDEAPRSGEDIYNMAPLICAGSEGSVEQGGSSVCGQSTGSINNKWACQLCTYLNWPKAIRCTQCLTQRPKAVSIMQPSTTQPLSINVSINTSAASSAIPIMPRRTSPRTSPNSPEAAKALNNDKNRAVVASQTGKWACKACTYENWPKSHKCILCGVSRGKLFLEISSSTESISSISEHESGGGGAGGLGGYGGECRNTHSPSPVQRKSPTVASSACTEPRELHSPVGATASPSPSQDRPKLRNLRTRLRDVEWQWLNACQGVVEGDARAVEAYLAAGGNPARQLTSDECAVLMRPSAFETGYTLVHLAIRFQREDMLAALLTATDVVSKAKKRVPSYVAPDIATEIIRDVSSSLRQRKGDFPCYFLTDITTFALPPEIEDLPNPIKKQLFDELLDKDAQKELEEEEPVINWSVEITERLGSRLYALWNRTAGDCLLDSVLQASWGIMDRENTLRHALAESLAEGAILFYPRWKESESLAAKLLHFSLEEAQWQQDWALLLSLAGEPGSSLEQIHILALAHILRRPIIVYGIKYVKSFRGENIGLARFQGVYLPLLWERSFCWRTPIALGYTRGHFSALVAMEIDMCENIGAGATIQNTEDTQTAYLPLTDCEGKVLPIHFLPATEIGHEEAVLHEWLDCCMTEGGLLVAQQKLGTPTALVRQMLDEWLQRYRSLASMVATHATRPSTTSTSSTGHGLSSDSDSDDE